MIRSLYHILFAMLHNSNLQLNLNHCNTFLLPPPPPPPPNNPLTNSLLIAVNMAKKLLSKRLEDEGDFWEEIDNATKQKILDQVRREMRRSKKTTQQSPRKELSKPKETLHKVSKGTLTRSSRHGTREKKPRSSKTPRGIVTSYGNYVLTPIDFNYQIPDNECYRLSGVFDYRSPTSPEKKMEDAANVVKPEPISLLATSESIGIDITTNDLIYNNICFPGQGQDACFNLGYAATENLDPPPIPKTKKPRSTPASATVTSAQSDQKTAMGESIDILLSQAKAESISYDQMSSSSYTEVSHHWSSTHRYEYNHGHTSYSPNRPELSPIYSYESGRSSTPDTNKSIAVYHTRASVLSTEVEVEKKITPSPATPDSQRKKKVFPRIMPPSPEHQERNPPPVNQTFNRPSILGPVPLFSIKTQRSEKRCPVCEKLQTNMKKHLVLSHLGIAWWGVLPDITCWKCRTYHTKECIEKCDGDFKADEHSQLLIQRHVDFFKFLMEDLNCATNQQLLNLVQTEGLCDIHMSPFTPRELMFLNKIDNLSGLHPIPTRDPNHPVRLTDILHWKTLAYIIRYAELNGTITGPAIANPCIAAIDTRADIVELYNKTCYLGLLENHPRMLIAGRLTNFNLAITDILDPGIMNSQLFHTLMQDPRILVSLGARPTANPNKVDSLTIASRLLVVSPKIAALGGVGLDLSLGTSTMPNQVRVFRLYMQAAITARRPLRVYTVGAHSELLGELVTGLPPKHFVHYLNFQGNYNEALEFLMRFPNGYLGMGRKMLKPTPDLVEIALKVDTKRMLPESNAPYHPFDFTDISTPPEVAEVVSAIANIKEMDRTSLTKTLRMNIHRIYKI